MPGIHKVPKSVTLSPSYVSPVTCPGQETAGTSKPGILPPAALVPLPHSSVGPWDPTSPLMVISSVLWVLPTLTSARTPVVPSWCSQSHTTAATQGAPSAQRHGAQSLKLPSTPCDTWLQPSPPLGLHLPICETRALG